MSISFGQDLIFICCSYNLKALSLQIFQRIYCIRKSAFGALLVILQIGYVNVPQFFSFMSLCEHSSEHRIWRVKIPCELGSCFVDVYETLVSLQMLSLYIDFKSSIRARRD
ncbi:hypothetical protein AVEN_69328-1 [Araneus ventricosus]|uniref:Uncharacterized protein n=1 Tax=Araneus ventricosus TaxID=182803 RepID=A0A4Y2K3J6_ARAVE|nr:hypothetical protein AVEN_69328-1 [Araneus ventricosus]